MLPPAVKMSYNMTKKKGENMEQENLTGRVLETAGLVEYQPGAVVSRTVMDKTAGTLTVFAFDEGQALSEHTAPFDALVAVLDGKAEISINGKAQTVSAGEMIIMPANEPHAVKAISPFKMMLVMIKA